MLVDLHAHTSGISRCCGIAADEVMRTARKAGIDGLVITNHYDKSYIENDDAEGFAERYIEECFYAEECGKREGVKVYRGIELSVALYPHVHILIYGADDDFIRRNPRMFDFTQKELYESVKENGGTVIQAHPFRNGTTVLDTDYLDGIEINCHPLYKNSYSEEILGIAAKNCLAVTCGGDYHADTYRPKCGVYLPEGVETGFELGEYIVKADTMRMCVHEPNEDMPKDVIYRRP